MYTHVQACARELGRHRLHSTKCTIVSVMSTDGTAQHKRGGGVAVPYPYRTVPAVSLLCTMPCSVHMRVHGDSSSSAGRQDHLLTYLHQPTHIHYTSTHARHIPQPRQERTHFFWLVLVQGGAWWEKRRSSVTY
nr:uncharacterized protein CTRU02_00485 [Colletotrichum truncatum]KAF6801736.1 hypothetical protein CTRU02_00485 [Colletotrichum truncatum]